jgi:RNA polymerase sigma-70 factor (ECF subfamily)
MSQEHGRDAGVSTIIGRSAAPADREAREALASGEYPRATECLARAYGVHVYRICWARLRNESEVDDAYQETLLAILKSLPRFRSEEPFLPWIATIAHNHVTQYLRERSRAARRFCDLDDVPGVEAPCPLPTPEDHTRTRQVWSAFHQALEGLPPKKREVLVKYHLENLTPAQIASESGEPVGTVRRRLDRATNQLQENLTARTRERLDRLLSRSLQERHGQTQIAAAMTDASSAAEHPLFSLIATFAPERDLRALRRASAWLMQSYPAHIRVRQEFETFAAALTEVPEHLTLAVKGRLNPDPSISTR